MEFTFLHHRNEAIKGVLWVILHVFLTFALIWGALNLYHSEPLGKTTAAIVMGLGLYIFIVSVYRAETVLRIWKNRSLSATLKAGRFPSSMIRNAKENKPIFTEAFHCLCFLAALKSSRVYPPAFTSLSLFRYSWNVIAGDSDLHRKYFSLLEAILALTAHRDMSPGIRESVDNSLALLSYQMFETMYDEIPKEKWEKEVCEILCEIPPMQIHQLLRQCEGSNFS